MPSSIPIVISTLSPYTLTSWCGSRPVRRNVRGDCAYNIKECTFYHHHSRTHYYSGARRMPRFYSWPAGSQFGDSPT